MLPQRGSVVPIVSFVRGIFKTWEDGLGGKERGKWEGFRQCLEEWIPTPVGSGAPEVSMGEQEEQMPTGKVSGEAWTMHPHTCWVLKSPL